MDNLHHYSQHYTHTHSGATLLQKQNGHRPISIFVYQKWLMDSPKELLRLLTYAKNTGEKRKLMDFLRHKI